MKHWHTFGVSLTNVEVEYEIVKMEDLSGPEGSVYSILPEGMDETLLESFIRQNRPQYGNEIARIVKRLEQIGKLGARSGWFTPNEGNPGDLVCAMWDDPDKNLRLYCIRYGMDLVVVGGGGPKPKNIRALQEDKVLTRENATMRQVSLDIYNAMQEGDMWFSADGMDLSGDLRIKDHEEE